MENEGFGRTSAPRARWRRVVLLAAALVGATLGASWWLTGAWNAWGGGPRLVVDRTEVDLGDFPFDAHARAVFTLTNAGDAPLRILEVPPVRAVKGC